MKKEDPDHRVFQRFKARFPVKIKDSRDDYGSNMFLRDASAEGIKIISREKFFLNDSISLSVKLPDGHDPLTLNGQVVWIRTQDPDLLWDVGLKFHKVDLMKAQRLFKFINEDSTV